MFEPKATASHSDSTKNRKSGDAVATSGLPQKEDIKRTSRHVRKVPKSDVTPRPREPAIYGLGSVKQPRLS